MASSKAFENTIKEYLDKFSAGSPEFAIKYSNEKKSIEECCNFICSEVNKMNVQGLADDEVYYLARHYYEEENASGKNVNCTVVVNHTIELTEEEKAAARERAIKKYEDDIITDQKIAAAKLKAQELAKDKKEQEKIEKAIKSEKKKEEEVGQLNLFDLLGG